MQPKHGHKGAHNTPRRPATSRASRRPTVGNLNNRGLGTFAGGSRRFETRGGRKPSSGPDVIGAPATVGPLPITRRQLFVGAAGAATLAAAVAVGYGVSEGSEPDSGPTLEVPESAVFTSADCQLIENPDEVVNLAATVELPYGSQVFASDGAVAACLLPSESSSPLATVDLLNLTSGNSATVLPAAVGAADGFEIFDARACTAGLIWVEADILDGLWRVYAAPLSDGAWGDLTGAAQLLAEGDGQWEMPTLAACGRFGWWTLSPRPEGDARTEDSLVMRARFGDGAEGAEELYRSHGRFATALAADASTVTIAPRSETAATGYDLVCLSGRDGQTIDCLALPAGMAPADVSYGDDGFAFSFDAIYNYGGGIANLGTYTPADAAAAGSCDTGEYSAQSWFRYDRAPLGSPAWCSSWFVVNSPTAVCAFDLRDRRYVVIEPPSGADSYGEYLASTGRADRFVTYANVDHQPIGEATIHNCQVRIWNIA